MRTSTKSAVAALAGAGLLLGGFGSLAYWQDSESAGPDTITSGALDLSAPDCGSPTVGTGWKVGATEVDLTSFRIVPGDTLTKTCTFTVQAVGDNLSAELSYTTPALDTNTLAGELTYAATYAVNPTAPGDYAALPSTATAITAANDGDEIAVKYSVTLPFGGAVDNDSNSGAEFISGKTGVVAGELTAVLSQLTLTATQVAS